MKKLNIIKVVFIALLILTSCLSRASWIDAKTNFTVEQSRPIFDRINRVYVVQISLTNTSNSSIFGPLRLTISNSSHETINHNSMEDAVSIFPLLIPELKSGGKYAQRVEFELKRARFGFDINVEQNDQSVTLLDESSIQEEFSSTETATIDSYSDDHFKVITAKIEDTEEFTTEYAFQSVSISPLGFVILNAFTKEGENFGVMKIVVGEGTVNVNFKIDRSDIFLFDAQNLTDDIAKGTILEKDGEGYRLTIPKQLISSWDLAEKFVSSGGDEMEVTVIEDDPIIFIGVPRPRRLPDPVTCIDYPNSDVRFCNATRIGPDSEAGKEYSFMEIAPQEFKNMEAKWKDWMAFAEIVSPRLVKQGMPITTTGHLEEDSLVLGNTAGELQTWYQGRIKSNVRQYISSYRFPSVLAYIPDGAVTANLSVKNKRGMYSNINHRLSTVFRYYTFGFGTDTVTVYGEKRIPPYSILSTPYKFYSTFDKKRNHIYVVSWDKNMSFTPSTVDDYVKIKLHGLSVINQTSFRDIQYTRTLLKYVSTTNDAIEGDWAGTYTFTCAIPNLNEEYPITMSLGENEQGLLSGTASYLDDIITFRQGRRGHNPTWRSTGIVKFDQRMDGGFFTLEHLGGNTAVNNEFYGQIEGDTLTGFTLNGDSATGCSAPHSVAGKIELTRQTRQCTGWSRSELEDIGTHGFTSNEIVDDANHVYSDSESSLFNGSVKAEVYIQNSRYFASYSHATNTDVVNNVDGVRFREITEQEFNMCKSELLNHHITP